VLAGPEIAPYRAVDVAWRNTARGLDEILWNGLVKSSAATIEVNDDTSWSPQLTQAVARFLQSQYRGGYLIIKTSTTGNRASTHEVGLPVLHEVLQEVRKNLPRGELVLADGPAFASYPSECQRLGWNEIATGFDIKVKDLNDEPALEVAPGWPVSEFYLKAGGVINLTKAKTHRRTGVSLAEKSLLGVLCGARLGRPKLVGKHHSTIWILQRIKKKSPPIFSVVDGIAGIQGEGPLRGP
jgi:uncharacterized protein (DUF362 family)